MAKPRLAGRALSDITILAGNKEGTQTMNTCQHCHKPTDSTYTLCDECELRFALTLYQIASDLTQIHDSLDATLHPGGHQPGRVILAVPPTPIRLEVLDLLDLIDSTTGELYHILEGTETPAEPLFDMLCDCAAAERLNTFPDAEMYFTQYERLARKADNILDPPEERREIGTCTNPLCGIMLTAGSRDQWVTCPICGTEQRVLTVKLKRLETLCFDQSKTGTASEISKAFTDSGITIRRNTINQWAKRGKINPQTNQDGKPEYAYCDIYRLKIAGAA
ncbi:hypothetical protein PT279_09095 [Bifidobacterium sp. ESL0784]|uniref:hypothetical protein n=1 Tax=Bifidobacterium sp. ESL0784 TaxID=2983231 RepID=UPI0023F986D4|nr:hypothetical protein [Bifidobacterium sp. ESL0784]MDF7641738.1 hypothetical protein [Bifidobacterium sp. ESL0784]